ncbi:MAG TPA: winged helix-turn-helix domain-containing protein [Trebonia sp.]
MSWWQVSADTLAGSRFVVSPLAETTASLLALERGTAAHPGERAWLDAHHGAYREYAASHPVVPRLVGAAMARCWIPALVTVAPSPEGEQAFADELARISGMPPGAPAADLAAVVGDTPLAAALSAPDLPARAAELLDWVWTEAVQPYWRHRRRIIQADIVARTTQLGQGGWAAALPQMRHGMRWLGEGRLQVNVQQAPPRETSGAQLVFAPVTPQVGWVAWDEPHRYAVMYPCSGALADPGDRGRPPEPLAALLGPARAAILVLLGTPKTTTQLAALTGQRLGSVGRHLKILRDARLLQRRRAGKSVLYYRSAEGDALVLVQDSSGGRS